MLMMNFLSPVFFLRETEEHWSPEGSFYFRGYNKWYIYIDQVRGLKQLIIIAPVVGGKILIIIIGTLFSASVALSVHDDRRYSAEYELRSVESVARRLPVWRREANRKVPSVSVTGALLTGNFFRGQVVPKAGTRQIKPAGHRGQRL